MPVCPYLPQDADASEPSEPSVKPTKSLQFAAGTKLPQDEDDDDAPLEVGTVGYDPSEKGETYDIYSGKSVTEEQSKRKSEDAVLIHMKAEAALKNKELAEKITASTSDYVQKEASLHGASAGRSQRARTAVAAPSPVDITPSEVDNSPPSEDSEDDETRQKGEEEEAQAKAKDEEARANADIEARGQGRDLEQKLPACADQASSPQANPGNCAAQASASTEQSQAATASSSPAAADSSLTASGKESIPLEELLTKCPASVDPAHKESYLSSADFVKAFGMEREAYDTLPKWKQVNAKKTAGLF